MQVPICRHIKSDGIQCRGLAVNGSVFCFFHRKLHRSHDLYRDKAYFQSAQSAGHHPFLQLPAMEDRASIQLAISSVINALATGCIDEKRAYALFNGLYLASNNARGLRIVRRPTHMVRDVCKESWSTIPETNPDLAPPGRTVEIEDEIPAEPTSPEPANRVPQVRRSLSSSTLGIPIPPAVEPPTDYGQTSNVPLTITAAASASCLAPLANLEPLTSNLTCNLQRPTSPNSTPSSKVVAHPNPRRKLVHPRIARRQVPIRHMEERERLHPQIDPVRHPELHAVGRLNIEVRIGRVGRQRLLVEGDGADLARHVECDPAVVPPQKPKTKRRNRETVQMLLIRTQRIAPEIGLGRFTQQNKRNHLGEIVHPRSQEAGPVMALVLHSNRPRIAPHRGAEDPVIAIRDHPHHGNLALDWRLFRSVLCSHRLYRSRGIRRCRPLGRNRALRRLASSKGSRQHAGPKHQDAKLAQPPARTPPEKNRLTDSIMHQGTPGVLETGHLKSNRKVWI